MADCELAEMSEGRAGCWDGGEQSCCGPPACAQALDGCSSGPAAQASNLWSSVPVSTPDLISAT